jgi:group I intron endonuclease
VGTIYRIRNLVDGKVYIGQAVNVKKRMYRHLWELRSDRHTNTHLQRAWNARGEHSFVFEIVEDDIDVAELTQREQYHIDANRSAIQEFGYNKSPAAGSNLGVKYSAESRRKMSEAQKGRTVTDEHRRRIAQSLTGKVASPESIAKRVAKTRGQKRTDETRRRLTEAHCARNGTEPIEAFGRTQHVNDWAREYGMNAGTLRNRLKRSGMLLEDALTEPSHRGRRKDLIAA